MRVNLFPVITTLLVSLTAQLAISAPTVIETDDYNLLLDSRGRVCALEIEPTDFQRWDNFAETVLDMRAVSKHIYNHFGDDFDFLFFVVNDQNGTGGGGRSYSVSNAVLGTGKTIYDSSANYGSSGTLQNAFQLTKPSALSSGPSLHEIMHRWANSLDDISNGGSHWGYSSVGGQLGGWEAGTLVDLGAGRYDADGPTGGSSFGTVANGGNSLPYSPLELYLMGLIPASEVPDTMVANNAAWEDSSQGVFTADSISIVTINDIIVNEGARTPDHTSSQKSFRALVVMLTPKGTPVTNAIWDQMDASVDDFSAAVDDGSFLYNFYEATGGRATMQMDAIQSSLLAGNESLAVTPSTDFVSTKLGDNPFNVTEISYLLKNENAMPISWTISHPAWLDASSSSGTLAAGAEVTVLLSLNSTANSLVKGNHTGIVRFINDVNGVYYQLSARLEIQDVIFDDDFENGVLDAAWIHTGTNAYRLRVTNTSSPQGTYHVILDDSESGDGLYARNELTLDLNLEGWSNVVLQFDAKEFGDESHSPPTSPFTGSANYDGVAISTGGDIWYEVQSLRSIPSVYSTFTVDIDSFLDAHELTHTSTFRIRFNQYDNFPTSSDGISLDNIRITGTSPTAAELWAISKGLTGDAAQPDADPDGDGKTNFEEFALDDNPTSGESSGKVVGSVSSISELDYLTLTFPVRARAEFSGGAAKVATIDNVTYQVQASVDLSQWSEEVIEIIPALDDDLPLSTEGWEYRSFRF